MGSEITVVRCPRCGSMDAESVEPVGIEFDRMGCAACGHDAICDREQIKDDWNDRIPEDALPTRAEWHVLPSVRFYELWAALGAAGHGSSVFLELSAAYREPHRAYHTARHIGACLRLLDVPEVRALAVRPAEVEAAIWFHDAVYDPRASDNEEQSARMVEARLLGARVAAEVVARIAAHVRATKGHATDSPDGRLLVDLDLAILGESPEAFAQFERGIRHEYAWVDEAAYAAGRAAVLRGFAERPSLYATPLFRERYEQKARMNLAASLGALSGAAPDVP
jgi:predicted metal-dependent HD superfamily phosphohydrolase